MSACVRNWAIMVYLAPSSKAPASQNETRWLATTPPPRLPPREADQFLPQRGRPWAALDPQLDIATGTYPRGDNEIYALFNGREAWPQRFDHLADAAVILVKTYEFLDDDAGRDMVRRLRERARAGCFVMIQYDFKGTAGFPTYWVSNRTPKVLWPLRGEPRVILVPCHVPRRFKNLVFPCDHKKYFITFAPGRAATLLMGGLNIGNRYCFGGVRWRGQDHIHGYRDTDLLVRGPVVRDAVHDYILDLATRAPDAVAPLEAALRGIEGPATYAPTNHRAGARLVSNAPRDKQWPLRLSSMFEVLLENVPAGQTVLLSNAYFCPIPRTREAIMAAAARGVKFIILNNSATVHDRFGSLMGFTGHGVMRRLWKHCPPGSLRLFEWNPDPQNTLCSIHQKVACFGDTGPVWVGSANLDAVSANRNFETVMLVHDEVVRNRFVERFYADLKRDNVVEVTTTSFGKSSWWQRFKEKVVIVSLGSQL